MSTTFIQIAMKKILIQLFILLPFLSSCQSNQKTAASKDYIEASAWISYGKYSPKGKIYVDKRLQEVDKSKASYYLEKETLGREIIPRFEYKGNTGDHHEDNKKYEDTPIIKYLYKYKGIQDDKIAIVTTASELVDAPGEFLFDGKAFSVYPNEQVHEVLRFEVARINGELLRYDDKGKLLETRYFDQGQEYWNTLEKERVHQELVGTWTMELENDGSFKKVILVMELLETGMMKTYQEIYYNDADAGKLQWRLSDSNVKEATTALWIYIPLSKTTGEFQVQLKGKTIENDKVTIIDQDHMKFEITYLAPEYADSKIKGYDFKRRK